MTADGQGEEIEAPRPAHSAAHQNRRVQTMANVILRVTLNETEGYLDVDQSGNGNQIPHNETDTIIWQLTGNMRGGQFNSMDAPNPGFAWKQSPPSGVFGAPDPDGAQMSILDHNTDPNGVNSAGTWIYQIWATTSNGQQYSTQATIANPRGVITDPTIRNQ